MDDYAESVIDFGGAVDMAINFKRGVLTFKQCADELRRIADEWENEVEDEPR